MHWLVHSRAQLLGGWFCTGVLGCAQGGMRVHQEETLDSKGRALRVYPTLTHGSKCTLLSPEPGDLSSRALPCAK